MKRREFLGLSLIVGAYSVFPKLLLAQESNLSRDLKGIQSQPAGTAQLKKASSASVDLEIMITAKPSQAQLLEGAKTQTWSYFAEVIKGDPSRVTAVSDSYLGPTLRFVKGEKVRITFQNELPEASIIHWHGFDVPHEMDGHPHFSTDPGKSYVYEFEVLNRAGTYWYHPHPHGRTGYQVFQGLSGLIIVQDPEEQSLNLPHGEQDLAFVIQDRRFDSKNQFLYVQNGHDQMMGLMGDKLFINGTTQKNFPLRPGSYRLRLLNGSNARPYNLKWSDGRPLKIIATDGGLLPDVSEKTNLFFGPAERLELIVDLTDADRNLQLLSDTFVTGRGGAFALFSLQVTDESPASYYPSPTKLSQFEKWKLDDAINSQEVKSFKLIPTANHGWTIDGLPFDMHNVTAKETARLGTIEVWEFDNTIAGMPHPIHIHGSQFQVLERTSGNFKGCMDEGWKDVVLLMPGDKVKLLKKFNSFAGDFIYHCHNLEHEDLSMMRGYRIIP